MNRWNIGQFEYGAAGFLKYWSIKQLNYSKVGIQQFEYRAVGDGAVGI
jgi:hypothetical protein